MIGLEAIQFILLTLVLTRHAHQPTNKNVRFKVQTYTDKGSTNRFKNGYNPKGKFNRESSYLIHVNNYKKNILKKGLYKLKLPLVLTI